MFVIACHIHFTYDIHETTPSLQHEHHYFDLYIAFQLPTVLYFEVYCGYVQGCCGWRAEGAMAPNFLKIAEFLEILMFYQKIFGLLLLVKIKVLNFIGKSLKLALLLYRRHDSPGYVQR